MNTALHKQLVPLCIGLLGLLCSHLAAGQVSGADCDLSGLSATYYDQNGVQRAYFTGNTVTRVDPQVNFNWGQNSPIAGFPGEDFSVRWSGYLVPSVSGNYQFSTRSDDGIRLYVGGSAIINQWNDHAQTTHYSGTYFLQAGQQYPIVLEFYERGVHAVAELYWQAPGENRRLIPSANLVPECLVTPKVPPAPLADYHFDETNWKGEAGEVEDSAGSNNGNALNGIDTVREGVVCRAGNFPSTNSTSGYAVDTGITPSSVANPAGSVSFWYRSASQWNSGVTRTLFDASSNSKYFTLTLDGNGRLRWGMEDTADDDYQTVSTSAYSFAAGTWIHLAVVWDISAADEAHVYLNGSEVTFNVDHLGRNTLGNLYSLYIGDNRSSYLAWASRRAASGDIDEFMIFNEALNQDQVQSIYNNQSKGLNYDGSERECPAELDHFAIVTSTEASTCSPLQVTLRAETAQGEVITDYDELTTLTTSSGHGNWQRLSANGTLTPNPDNDDNGTAQYTFVESDNGEIALNLTNIHAETLRISVGNGEVTSTSGNVTFRDNVFVISSADSLGQDTIAGRNHQFTATMMRRDPSTGNCGPATSYSPSGLKAWHTPSPDDPGGVPPQLLVGASSHTLPATRPGTDNLSLKFVQGQASFLLTTEDVGQYRLRLEDSNYQFSDQSIETLIPGDSPLLTVRPFGFYLEVDGNLAASSADGAIFANAGDEFSVVVGAVGWQSADDQNDDGVPDGHQDGSANNNSDLSDNPLLRTFGQEGESITLDSVLLAPSSGHDPGLGGDTHVTEFSNGLAKALLQFNEVGIINLTAAITDGNYLGAGLKRTLAMRSDSGYVGRFTPAYFQLQTSTLTPACSSGFTYLQQPMSSDWTISARSAVGSVTQNYDGPFIKLGDALGSVTYRAKDKATGTLLNSRLSADQMVFKWDSGEADVTSALTVARLDGLNSQDGPFSQTDIGLLIEDDDGRRFAATALNLDSDATSGNDSVLLGSTQLRYGRLLLRDAHGPESADLPADFLVEYWDGQRFVRNTLDNCSQVPLSQIRYPEGALSDAGFSISVGGGTSSGSYLKLEPTLNPTAVSFVAGNAGQEFSAPGAGNTGRFTVSVNLTGLPWLQYDWNGNGSYTDNVDLPNVSISFGSYRGHDRIIYWREVYQ